MQNSNVDERVWTPVMPSAPTPSPTRWDISTIVSVLVIAASVGYGGWLTAHSILDGDVAGSLVRFAAATLIGTYYLVLYRISHRRRTRRS